MNIGRYYSDGFLTKLGFKPKLRSRAHLEFIKRMPCICTGAYPVDAHHVQRKAQGINDYACIPLSHEVHLGELHQKGVKFVEDKYGVDLKDALIAKLIERIWELENGK